MNAHVISLEASRRRLRPVAVPTCAGSPVGPDYSNRARNTARFTQNVNLDVAGECEVYEDVLVRRLGHSAWTLWQGFARKRGPVSETRITVAQATQGDVFRPMAPAVAKDAMKRLVAAGLIERIRCVPMATRKDRFLKLRRVRGVRLYDVTDKASTVQVPLATKEWLMTANGHGGRRGGSGIKNPQTVGKHPQTAHAKANQAPPSSLTLSKGNGDGTGGSLPTEENQAAGAAGPFLSVETLEDGTSGFGVVRSAPPTPSTPLVGVPAYPGWSIVTPAVVPEAPKLQAADAEDYKVRLLASAFRGAVEREYGVSTFLLAKLTPRSKSYVLLAKAARELERFGVAPAAWCIFAVRRWFLARTHTGGWTKGDPVALPPIGVVFSVRMIAERLGDEDKRGAVESCALGGQVIFGETHKALLVRYNAMRAAINRGADRAQAVALFFPGTSYDDLVDSARAEARETRMRIEGDITRGRVVW